MQRLANPSSGAKTILEIHQRISQKKHLSESLQTNEDIPAWSWLTLADDKWLYDLSKLMRKL